MATLVQDFRAHTRHPEISNFIYRSVRNTHTNFYRSRIQLQTLYTYTDFAAVINFALHKDINEVSLIEFITQCPGQDNVLRAELSIPAVRMEDIPELVTFRLLNCANNNADYLYYKNAVLESEESTAIIEATDFIRPDGSVGTVEYIMYTSDHNNICVASVYNSEVADKLMCLMAAEYIAHVLPEEADDYTDIVLNMWNVVANNTSHLPVIGLFDNWYDEHFISQRRERARSTLATALDNFSKTRLDTNRSFQQQIERMKSTIREKEDDLRRLYTELQKANLKMITAEVGQKDETIVNFTRVLQNLINKNVIQDFTFRKDSNVLSNITFTVETPITFWEEDEATAYANYLVNAGAPIFKRAIFKKIFINKEITVHTRTRIEFDLEYNRVHVLYTEVPEAADSHPYPLMSHPHVGWFSCFGDNQSSINRCLSEHDLAGALGYTMSSLTQMNLADYVVTNRLMSGITGQDTGSSMPWEIKTLEYKGVMLTGKTLVSVINTELHGGETT